jgi:hypothetical protein
MFASGTETSKSILIQEIEGGKMPLFRRLPGFS